MYVVDTLQMDCSCFLLFSQHGLVGCMQSNSIGSAGAHHLANCLMTNQTLVFLGLNVCATCIAQSTIAQQ
jgi:hypothetical protein